MKTTEFRKLIREEVRKVLSEAQYSNKQVNLRDEEVAPGVINHMFDIIDVMDLNNGYKVKITTTYWYRDPKTKGYSYYTSKENPQISEVKTILLDPSGKPIKSHDFSRSIEKELGKEEFIQMIVGWWNKRVEKFPIGTPNAY